MKGKKIINKVIATLCVALMVFASNAFFQTSGMKTAIASATEQVAENDNQNYRVVGYLPAYRSNLVDKIDYSALTHLNLSFMRYKDGQLVSDHEDSVVEKVVSHCHNNNVKVLIAVGGGGVFDTASKPFNTKESRAEFIDTIVDYVNLHNLDGVDVDIECTDSDIIANYEYFVEELREALDDDKILTMAVAPWFTRNLNSTIYDNFDFINLMTYDDNVGDGPVATMEQIDAYVDCYTAEAVDTGKMTIGVPFYGYGPGGYSDAYTYANILSADENNKYNDECIIDGKTVYYNGETTIKEKAELAKQYGGIMIWELGQDSFDDNSLLGVIKKVVKAQKDNTENTGKGRVIGYFPSYRSSEVDKVDYSVLTHLNLSFMRYTNGQLKSDFSDSLVKKVLAHCRENDVKVMIAIGGGGGFDADSKPFNTKESRAEFIGTIIDYVNQYGLDGVDVDIECTDSDIIANYEYFVEELREALGNGKLLTMAVSPWFTKKLSSTIYNNLDFINLMTYDYKHGDGPLAPMSQIETHREHYTSQGVTLDRMNIGVPFYGYGPGGYDEEYKYSEIIEADPNNRFSDECVINGHTIYYNGEPTIREKAQLSKQYGGIMIWELGQDSFGEYSLLQAIKEELQLGEENTTTEEQTTIVETTTDKSTEEQTTVVETTTEELTESETTSDMESKVKLEIDGWQISTVSEGYRTIYSVSDSMNEVEKVGLIYGLADYVAEPDMIVGSANNYVHSYESTEAGRSAVVFSEMESAQSYVMTMKFIHSADFYKAGIDVRAYAKLHDGSYIYSDVYLCSVYEIADCLYQNLMMSTNSSHDYLYTKILSVVDTFYEKVDYEWSPAIVNQD